jgi:hypothetical protein
MIVGAIDVAVKMRMRGEVKITACDDAKHVL